MRLFDVFYGGAEDHGDAPLLEEFFHVGGGLAIHHGHEACAAIKKRDFCAERVADGRELHADGAATDDDDVLGHATAMQDAVGVADARDVEGDVVRSEGTRSRPDEDYLCAQLALTAVLAGNDYASVGIESSSALDVVHA